MSSDDVPNLTDVPPAPLEGDVHQRASDIKLTQVARRYDNARTALAAVALIVATSCLLIIITLLLRINDLAEQSKDRGTENQQLIKSTNATAKLIEDCTTPTGQCSLRQEQRTGVAIRRINEVTVASNWCALQREYRTYEQVRACVVRLVGQ